MPPERPKVKRGNREDENPEHPPLVQDPELVGLSKYECHAHLRKKWIESNPEIPEDVKKWVLEILERRYPLLLGSTSTTSVSVRYDALDKDGPAVILRFRTAQEYANISFREHHLKWFLPRG